MAMGIDSFLLPDCGSLFAHGAWATTNYCFQLRRFTQCQLVYRQREAALQKVRSRRRADLYSFFDDDCCGGGGRFRRGRKYFRRGDGQCGGGRGQRRCGGLFYQHAALRIDRARVDPFGAATQGQEHRHQPGRQFLGRGGARIIERTETRTGQRCRHPSSRRLDGKGGGVSHRAHRGVSFAAGHDPSRARNAAPGFGQHRGFSQRISPSLMFARRLRRVI